MHSTVDLRCIQCHVNPMTLHAQNQNNPLVHLFVGRVHLITILNMIYYYSRPDLLYNFDRWTATLFI